MLQVQAVSPKLLGLLNSLAAYETLSSFYLVGGTALALQIGHRISVDLDFFGSPALNELEISQMMRETVSL